MMFALICFTLKGLQTNKEPSNWEAKSWVQLESGEDSAVFLSVENSYGDEIIYPLEKGFVEFATSKLIFVSIIKNSKYITKIPCFPNDTTRVNLSGKQPLYTLKHKQLLYFDTAFYSSFQKKYATLYNKINAINRTMYQKHSEYVNVRKKKYSSFYLRFSIQLIYAFK